MSTFSPTPFFGSIVPSQKPQTLQTNYLNFTDSANPDFSTFAQQYLPEIYEQEVERYGNRTLSGFLRMVGAEMPMTSDQVVWSEQNRLHIAYTDVTRVGNVLTIPTATGITNVISKGQTIVVIDSAGQEVKAYVNAVSGTVEAPGSAITAIPYLTADASWTGFDDENLKIFVYGSEFRKGTDDDTLTSVQPSFTQYSNSPIIIKSKYVVNGSDTAQIGWVEITTEEGADGFLWFLKAESETRLRFEDYLEMAVVEGELATNTAVTTLGIKGTEGLFAAVKDRGNQVADFSGDLTDFDTILKNLDTQGAIEENMIFNNRQMSLLIDDMLATMNSYGAGGTSYGLFENSEKMALNLGFSGFRRGSYDFYKTDWKYLNDASTRGALANSSISGLLVPAGTSTVYDEILGTNIRRPFLHVRYRASQYDDRRMKHWITGSVGAQTSALDAMEVHFLSERCLCVQGANNFVLFTTTTNPTPPTP
jgi:hypothetical protein